MLIWHNERPDPASSRVDHIKIIHDFPRRPRCEHVDLGAKPSALYYRKETSKLREITNVVGAAFYIRL